MWTLVRYPEVAKQLREDESLLKPFIEEVLRWESPVQFLARQAKKDVEISGTMIPAGSLVMVGYGPANRDEEKFGCPHQFDLERKGVGAHLAFGSGRALLPRRASGPPGDDEFIQVHHAANGQHSTGETRYLHLCTTSACTSCQ